MKGFLKNGGLFLLLAALTLWVIGKETDPKQILEAVTGCLLYTSDPGHREPAAEGGHPDHRRRHGVHLL